MVEDKKIIVALDYDQKDHAYALLDKIDPSLCRVKIGKELFTKYGSELVLNVQNKGFDVFLDLKFHDIPTTVYKACISAFSLNIWMLNIHLSGGLKMSLEAVRAKKDSQTDCKLIGVTVLTSLSDNDCLEIYGCNRSEQVQKFKEIGKLSNIDGFVCSPLDITDLNDSDKIFVTPGIRIDSKNHDHHRVISPKEAMNLGSTYLVIGRSITEDKNPNSVLRSILNSLKFSE